MKGKAIGIVAYAVGALMVSASAFAGIVPSNIDIDFRSAEWAPANGVDPYAVNYANFGEVKAIASPDGKVLYQDSIDGLGVKSDPNKVQDQRCVQKDEVDEIQGCETLTVLLGGIDYSKLSVTTIWLTDLFKAKDGVDGEQARIRINWADGSFDAFTVTGDQVGNNGEFMVDITGYTSGSGDKAIDNIRFFVPGRETPENFNDEYSVAGFTVVPEPAVVALMGLGLVGFAAMRRRRS